MGKNTRSCTHGTKLKEIKIRKFKRNTVFLLNFLIFISLSFVHMNITLSIVHFVSFVSNIRERSLSICNWGWDRWRLFEKWFMPHPSIQEITWAPSNNRKIISCTSLNFLSQEGYEVKETYCKILFYYFKLNSL